MKLFYWIITLAICSTLFSCTSPETPNDPLRVPTDIAGFLEEKEAFKKGRKAWMENMHQAAPGVDWRAINAKTRREKARQRALQMGTSSRSGYLIDTVANGLISGHWREIGSRNVAGRTVYSYYHKLTDDLYIAADGGNVWKGKIDGSQWTVLNDKKRIAGLMLLEGVEHASQGLRLMVATDDWNEDPFMYSDNEGQTWQFPTGLWTGGNSRRGLRAIVANDSLRTIYLLEQYYNSSVGSWEARINKSEDHGQSFSVVYAFDRIMHGTTGKIDIWIENDDLYALDDRNVYLVSPSGQVTLKGSLPAPSPGNVLLTGYESQGQTTLYALQRAGSLSAIFRSVDAGATWTNMDSVTSWTFSRNSFNVISNRSAQGIFVGGIDCYRSTSGGSGWTKVNDWWEYYGDEENKLHADISSVLPYEDQNGDEFVIINTDGGSYISRDGLQTVKNISLTGLQNGMYYSVYSSEKNPDHIHIGTQDQGYQRATEDLHTGPIDFTQIISGDYGHIVSGDSGASIWMNYPGFSDYYPNASFSTQHFTKSFSGMQGLWLPPLVAEPGNSGVAYLGGGSLANPGEARIIRLEANVPLNQMSFTEQSFDFSLGTNASISALAISPLNHSFRYICTDNGKFFWSPDGGSNWNETPAFSAPGSHYFYGNAILASPISPSRVFIGGSGYSNPGVYVSDNLGQRFKPLSNGLPPTLVYDIASTPDEQFLFAATHVGPYVFTMADSMWHSLEGAGAPDQLYWTVEYIPSRNIARFGTYGRGTWDFVMCGPNVPGPQAAYAVSNNGSLHTFQNQSVGAYQYQWDFGDGTFSTEEHPTHTFTQSGAYPVTLIAGTYCSNDTLAQEVVFLFTDTDLPIEKSRIQVYPNPATDKVFLENTREALLEMSIEVYDAKGSQVRDRVVATLEKGDRFGLDVSSLISGVYYLKLSTDKEVDVQKILVK